MEAGMSLLSPTPHHLPRTHPRNPLSSTSVLMLHDQGSRPTTSLPTRSIVRQFPPSVFTQEPQNDYKTYLMKEKRMVQTTLDMRPEEGGLSLCEEREKQRFTAPCTEENKYLAISTESIASDTNVAAGSKPILGDQTSANSVQPGDVLALENRAVISLRKASLLVEKSNNLESEFDQSSFLGSDLNGFTQDVVTKDETVVRSKRLLERQSRKRKVPKKPDHVSEVSSAVIAKRNKKIAKEKQKDAAKFCSSAVIAKRNKKIAKGLNTDDPFGLFLWGPETKQLLTAKEEKDLFLHVQELMRLEEATQRLKMQFSREPTVVEWAGAVGMSCQVLLSRLRSGNRSQERMIYANFRLVIHIAKQYEGKGLDIQDLLQEGSRGLMKSLEKFNPKAGCRFASYAYWWIRHSIRKAIFRHSRIIRLPENVYALLKKITDARRLCIQEGHIPTNQELAKRVDIRVEKLESLLSTSRKPISLQERVCIHQCVTFQEICMADPQVEIPDRVISKQMMRQHVHNFLGVLNSRERHIIKSRYGIHGSEKKTLSEIGAIYGISKERVRQLESVALDKLKGCVLSEALDTYINLLV